MSSTPPPLAQRDADLLPSRTLTVETQDEMERVCLRNIDAGLKTGKFTFTVPEQVGKF